MNDWPRTTGKAPTNESTYRQNQAQQPDFPEDFFRHLRDMRDMLTGDAPALPSDLAGGRHRAVMQRLDRLENALQRRVDFLEARLEALRDVLPPTTRRSINKVFKGAPR
jgi:hypothetical protein